MHYGVLSLSKGACRTAHCVTWPLWDLDNDGLKLLLQRVCTKVADAISVQIFLFFFINKLSGFRPGIRAGFSCCYLFPLPYSLPEGLGD
jgi:hypothetical protein